MRPISRREFMSVCSALGIGVALAGCSGDDDGEGDDDAVDSSTSDTAGEGSTDTDGTPESSSGEPATASSRPELADGADEVDVIIIGAGPAGMAAAHLLRQRGVPFRILEAAPTYGGRIVHDAEFTDFPIPLGAEWLHVDREQLPRIVNDDSVVIETDVVAYDPDDTIGYVEDGTLVTESMGEVQDLKFVGTTWFGFFEDYIVPGIESAMVFDTQIVEISYGDDGVRLTDAVGGVWDVADVIVTVPMKILQDGDITFDPELPSGHRDALDAANIWSGMKVFLEFSEAFYPTYLEFADDEGEDGQRAYYDAAYGQDSDSNVLGLFLVGTLAEEYQALDGDALLDRMLNELDEIFDGAASRTYVKHRVQNWNEQPFARAAYLADTSTEDIPNALSETVGEHVYFAGDGYTREPDWSAVHNAVRSARAAVDELVG